MPSEREQRQQRGSQGSLSTWAGLVRSFSLGLPGGGQGPRHQHSLPMQPGHQWLRPLAGSQGSAMGELSRAVPGCSHCTEAGLTQQFALPFSFTFYITTAFPFPCLSSSSTKDTPPCPVPVLW